MILSIKTDSGKVLFDGFNRIEHFPVDRTAAYDGSVIDFRNKQQNQLTSEAATYSVEIELFRDGIFIERLLTHAPVFVMNDKGETIERI